MTNASLENNAPNAQSAQSLRAWSLADPMWWATMLGAVVVAGVTRRALPGDPADFTHYAAGVALAGFIAISTYWRLRLRATWFTSVALAAAIATAILAIGWVKGLL
ncbi:MAG: hypothetical protein M3Z05_01715 [Gemmatimonadota bacterium]|nr:hypothetical protein [Gemmatimonadota bacterium]